METPSSTRRITRSQAKVAMSGIPSSGKIDESETILSSRQRNTKPERSALIDITNDSPITGLAMGLLKTPLSHAKEEKLKKTPGSGETLLRGQVKTLLQKVEEGAELVKLPFDHYQRPFVRHLQEIVKSPSGLLAPTPVNTPNVPNLSYSIDADVKVSGLISVTASETDQPQDVMAVEEGSEQENLLESEKSLTRSLLFDFSEKSEVSDSSSPCSSVLTSQEGSASRREKLSDEDDASVWSIQVNASSIQDEDEEEEDIVEEDYVDEDDEEDYDDEDGEEGGLLDELCAGLSKISVQEKKIPAFEGKHTRFVYNSDDEIEREEEVKDVSSAAVCVSPGVLHLKGMPLPEGKHLRFQEEED